MSKHHALLLAGKEIDPNEFWFRFNQITNLLRGLGNALEGCSLERNRFEPSEALRGLVALLEDVNDDVALYFNHRTPKEAAAEEAALRRKYRLSTPPRSMPPSESGNGSSGESSSESAQH
jgi:hypothetical protein